MAYHGGDPLDPGDLFPVMGPMEMMDEFIHLETVVSPEDALRVLKSGAYGCIVSDFQMPPMDGHRACPGDPGDRRDVLHHLCGAGQRVWRFGH